MAYDPKIHLKPIEEQAEAVWLKLNNKCFTDNDRRYSLGGLATKQFVSKKALSKLVSCCNGDFNAVYKTLAKEGGTYKGFVNEHGIPVSLVMKQLMSSSYGKDKKSIEKLIASHAICYALLTKEEDKVLSELVTP